MLPLGLFARPNFRWGNVETVAMYGGLAIFGFFVVLFLQQVAGWSALQAGTISLVPTGVMFLLSRRFGALADRFGPRPFMGFGPLVAAAGLALLVLLPADLDYWTDLLPPLLLFSLGLAPTVAPLTATVLAGADESNAGIASGVNNAIARVAGLLATAAIGAAVAAQFSSALDERLVGVPLDGRAAGAVERVREQSLGRVDPAAVPAEQRERVTAAATEASESAFHTGMGIAAALVAVGGVLGLVGIRDERRRPVQAGDCAGGQLVGAPRDAARERPARERPAAAT